MALPMRTIHFCRPYNSVPIKNNYSKYCSFHIKILMVNVEINKKADYKNR